MNELRQNYGCLFLFLGDEFFVEPFLKPSLTIYGLDRLTPWGGTFGNRVVDCVALYGRFDISSGQVISSSGIFFFYPKIFILIATVF
ncbi:MAG: hypothetical protein M5Z89_10900 [Olivibacter sp.]|nr:hypothetical protein [Olivibacter sp. UJ_SKK_5.1]